MKTYGIWSWYVCIVFLPRDCVVYHCILCMQQQEDHVRRLESERARVCSSTIILGAEKHASMIQTLCDGVANSDACLRMLDDSLHKVQCDRSNRLKKIRDLEGDAVGVQKHVKRLVQHNHVTRDLLEDERILLNRYQHDIRDTQERIYTSMQKSMSQQMTLDRVMWRREREREHAAHVQHAVLELQKTLESQSSRWMGQKTSLAQIEKYHHNVSRETHEMQWYIQQVLGTLMQACHGQQHHASQNKLEYPSTILEYIMHGIEDALQKEQCVYREICDSYHAACDRMHGHMQERSNITTRYDLIIHHLLRYVVMMQSFRFFCFFVWFYMNLFFSIHQDTENTSTTNLH